MDVKERIRGYWAANIRTEGEKLTAKNAEGMVERARFREEMGPMVLQHRELFYKLNDLGVIGIFQQVTADGVIAPHLTSDEEVRDLAGPFFEKTGQSRKKRAEGMSVEDYIREESFPKWYGRIVAPAMNRDGSASSILQMEMYQLDNKEEDRRVYISYSPANVLIIRGEGDFYSAVVNEETVNLDDIADGFAKMMAKPAIAAKKDSE